MLNDGQIHQDFYNLSDEEKNKIASEFSEGNEQLKQILINLWSKKVKTYGCCNGHDEGTSTPYISFELNTETSQVVSEMIDFIVKNGISDAEVSFSNKENGNVVVLVGTNQKFKNVIFGELLKQVQQEHTNTNERVNIKYAQYLNKFANQNNLNYRYGISGDEMMLGFRQSGISVLFNPDAPALDEGLKKLLDTGSFPLISYKCDDEAVRMLLNIMYPQEEDFKDPRERKK